MSQIIPIYIPTYISDQNYNPSRVLPRLFFYNGMINCEQYYIESGSLNQYGIAKEQTAFPYFDNYNVVTGSYPSEGSRTLLFNNEAPSYGAAPTASLYTEYWEEYVSLLYNPRTRLLNCSAIIPLADYVKMELNDIVNFRGNYYHLRAINDYSLKDGTCSLQLLGPIIPDSFDVAVEPTPAPPETGSASSSVSWSFTEIGQDGTFNVFDNATTLATLTANGTGNSQISESHYVTASLSPVSYPASGSVTMSLFVNGGTTISQTVYTNTTISASFLVGSGSSYGITGSIQFNSGSAPAPSGSTLSWNYSVTGGPTSNGLGIKVNSVTVISRNSTSSGTYPVNVGDVINVVIQTSGCSGGSGVANSYASGIISDAACDGSNSITLTSTTYTVVSGDVGNTLTLNTFSSCDSGCI